MDYEALAKQFGGTVASTSSAPPSAPNQINYEEMAKQFGGAVQRQNVGAEPERSIAGFGKNVVRSGGEMLGGIYQAVRHPINTVGTLGDIATGAVYNMLPSDAVKFIDQFDSNPANKERAIKMANAIGGVYKERYGSLEALGNTLYNDPVGAIGDLSTILSGGGAALAKAGKIAQLAPAATGVGGLSESAGIANAAAAVAPLARPVARFGQGLEQVGGAMLTAGKYTNPLLPVEVGVKYAAANPIAQKIGGVAAAPFKAVYNVAEPFIPGGNANIKARGYAEALNNDPTKINAAIQMLQQGKPIEQVAVALNSSGLAAFAREAQDSSVVIRDLYNARDAALKASQANQLAGASANLNALNQQNMPVSNVSPNAPRRAVNQSLSAEAQTLEAQKLARTNQLTAEQQVAADAFAAEQAKISGNVANVSQVDLGGQLAKANEAILKNTTETVTGPAYKAAFEAAPKPTIDVNSLATVAKGQLDNLVNQLENLAPNAAALLQKYGPRKEVVNMGDGLTTTVSRNSKPITLEEAHQLRQAINIDRAAIKSSIEPGANITRKNLNDLYTALNDSIKKGTTAGAYELFQKANDTFRKNIVEVHRTGSPANLSRTSTLNQPMLVGEDIIPKLLSSEGETRQFLKIFGQDPAAMKNIATGVEDLYRQAVLSPTAGANAHAAFMAKYEKQLAELDKAGAGIRSRLKSIGEDLGKVKTGREAVELATKEIPTKITTEFANQDAALKLASKTLNFKNTNDLRAAVVKDPMAMDMALRRMDVSAKASLARGILQDAMAGDGAKALENLTKNEQTIMTALKAHNPKTAAKTFADAKQMADIRRLIEETGNKLPAATDATNALTTAKNIEGLTQGLPEVRSVVQKIQQELQTGADFEKLAAQGMAAGGGSSRLATEAVGKQPNIAFSKKLAIANIVINRLKGKIDNKLAVEIANELARPSTAAEALIKSQVKRAEVSNIKTNIGKSLNALTSPSALAVERANQPNQNALAR